MRDALVSFARPLLKTTREPFLLRTGLRLLRDRFRCECLAFLRYHRLKYVTRITGEQKQHDTEHTHRVPSRKVEALRGCAESTQEQSWLGGWRTDLDERHPYGQDEVELEQQHAHDANAPDGRDGERPTV